MASANSSTSVESNAATRALLSSASLSRRGPAKITLNHYQLNHDPRYTTRHASTELLKSWCGDYGPCRPPLAKEVLPDSRRCHPQYHQPYHLPTSTHGTSLTKWPYRWFTKTSPLLSRILVRAHECTTRAGSTKLLTIGIPSISNSVNDSSRSGTSCTCPAENLQLY